MELKNCPECGKIFAYVTVNLCPACLKVEEEEFQRVKAYLYKHPHTGVYDLAEATEVEEHKIIRWLKMGRLEGKRFTGIDYPCESCGRNIRTGRFCPKCTNELTKDFTQATQPPKTEQRKKDSNPRFHTRN